MRAAITIIFIAALLPGAAVNATVFSSQEWGTITPEERQLQAPAGSPDAGSVFIFDKGMVVTEFDGPQLKRHVRIKILNSSVIPRLNPIVIESVWYDEIFDVEALVHRADGTQINIDKKNITEFKDETRRTRTITFPDLKAGDIIEYRYAILYYGGYDKLGAEKYFLFSQSVSWRWVKSRKSKVIDYDDPDLQRVANIPAWYFDNFGPTLFSQYIAKIGANLDYTCVPSNVPRDKQVPESHRGKGIIDRVYVYYTWTLEDVPAIRPEPFMARPNDFRPSLHFDLFSSPGENRIILGTVSDGHWNYVGKNFQGYLSMYVGKQREIRSETAKILAGQTSDESKAGRLYGYVRDNYSFDSSGYRMRSSNKNLAEFRKKKSGSPFEMNILLVEMLKAADIDAWPVLINTRGEADFHRTGRFNHIIVFAKMDAGSLYLDASSKTGRYGVLPPPCLVDEGVLVDFDNSQLQRVLSPAQDSYRVDSMRLSLDGTGCAAVSRVSSLSGYPAMELGLHLAPFAGARPKPDIRLVLSDLITSEKMRWNCDSLGFCTVETDLPAGASPSSASEGMTMPIASWLNSNPLPAEERKQPVDFVYPFKYESTAIFSGSDSVMSIVKANDVAFGIAGASFLRETRQLGDSVGVTVRLVIEKPVFPVAEYSALRGLFEKAVTACSKPIFPAVAKP